MNGIEKITAKLEADALAEVAAVNAETKAQCDEIKNEYEQKAQEEYTRSIQNGTKSVSDRVSRLGSAADMEAKKFILGFKQEMVTKAFDHAVKSILSMPKESYVKFLASQAAKAAVTGTEELIFSASDKQKVGADVAKSANALLEGRGLAGKLTVSDKTREMPGGVVIKNGDIEVNCSVDTLVQLSKSELASQVAEILFA